MSGSYLPGPFYLKGCYTMSDDNRQYHPHPTTCMPTFISNPHMFQQSAFTGSISESPQNPNSRGNDFQSQRIENTLHEIGNLIQSNTACIQEQTERIKDLENQIQQVAETSETNFRELTAHISLLNRNVQLPLEQEDSPPTRQNPPPVPSLPAGPAPQPEADSRKPDTRTDIAAARMETPGPCTFGLGASALDTGA